MKTGRPKSKVSVGEEQLQAIRVKVARERGKFWAYKIGRQCWSDDIAQEIHMVFLRRSREWRGSGPYELWCRTVADSCCKNLIRAWKRQKRGMLMPWRPLLPGDRIALPNHDQILASQLIRTITPTRRQQYAIGRYLEEIAF